MRTVKLIIALLLCLLLTTTAFATTCESVSLGADRCYAANLFLSNFTEVGVRSLRNASADSALVDFAHDHLWFNSYDQYEYGEYFNENNCRVSDARIQKIIDDYFYDSHTVDRSDTSYDYKNGYYYHCETGGWTNDGFALAIDARKTDEKTYLITFAIFGGGNQWTNDDLRLSFAQAAAKFGDPDAYGSALVHTSNLADRSTYKLISFSKL